MRSEELAMRKFLFVILVCCIVFTFVSCSDTQPITMTENSVMTSGICGNELTWVLDKNGTLTVSGKGDMWDFSAGDDSSMPPQWIDAKRTIMKVVVEDGVTSIGESAFDGCCNLLDVELPDSVSFIGRYAFNSTRIARIEIPQSMTIIGDCVFWRCENLDEIVIHSNVTEISKGAFYIIPEIFYNGTEQQWNLIKCEDPYDGTIKTYAEYIKNYDKKTIVHFYE